MNRLLGFFALICCSFFVNAQESQPVSLRSGHTRWNLYRNDDQSITFADMAELLYNNGFIFGSVKRTGPNHSSLVPAAPGNDVAIRLDTCDFYIERKDNQPMKDYSHLIHVLRSNGIGLQRANKLQATPAPY
jgi:hypothetical protein